MHTPNSKNNIPPILLILPVITLIIGMGVGALVLPGPNQLAVKPELKGVVQKFSDVLRYIDQKYIEKADFNTLTETAIVKMLEKLDPHSTYFTAQQLAAFNASLQGASTGIGVVFRIYQDTVYVIETIPGGPADQAGIQPGDRILTVDGEAIGKSSTACRDKIQGAKGTSVKLGIQRQHADTVLIFTVIRDTIAVPSVKVDYMLTETTGYINITNFAITTCQEFKKSLACLKKQGMKQLVLDLRNNTGGYMEPAIEIAQSMLAKEKLIGYLEGKQYPRKNFYTQGKDPIETFPLIVLINEMSASAAEILAGALQDHDRALIVGRRSFGKGLVQLPIKLRDNDQLNLTIARYFTPSGRCIQKSYDAGIEAYNQELIRRYIQGECTHEERIHLDDSLQYATAQGRPLYGGGGIMPDIFIPIDTLQRTDYWNQLENKNILYEYACDYVDKHRIELTAMSYKDYKQKFKIPSPVLQEIVDKANQAHIAYDEKQFQAIKKDLQFYVKAYIADHIWGKKGSIPILHQKDTLLQKAIQCFDKAINLLSPTP